MAVCGIGRLHGGHVFGTAPEMMTVPLQTESPPDFKAAASDVSPRPPLVLRIGTTGHRALRAARLEALRAQMHEVLELARDEMNELAQDEAVKRFYASGPPVMRMVSPLAKGSDRLAANCALGLGYELYAPLPFARAEYEKDFTGTDPIRQSDAVPLSAEEDMREFAELMEKAGADWLALDGDPKDRDRAYENVGRFVVRHSDIVIAVWNGEPAAGRGGSAEIIEHAVSHGVPVWWIHATEDKPPKWIGDIGDLRDPQPNAEAPKEQLRSYLNRQIRVPERIRVYRHGLFENVARLGQSREVSPIAEYEAEEPRPARGVWRIYSWMMLRVSGCNPPWTPPRPPSNQVALFWYRLYQPADARAGEYAARYRSSYVWVFILATLAVLFGVCANLSHEPLLAVCVMILYVLCILAAVLCLPWRKLAADRGWHNVAAAITTASRTAWGKIVAAQTAIVRGAWHFVFLSFALVFALAAAKFLIVAAIEPAKMEDPLILASTLLEASMLSLIMFIVIHAIRCDWHSRSIEYRLLAELCRKEQVLAPLGNSVSLGAVRHIVNRLDADAAPDHAAWVAWVFAAFQRAAPLPRGNVHAILPEAVDEGLVEGLIEEQREYHKGRHEMAREAGKKFELLGGWSFVGVLVAVVFKLLAVILKWNIVWEVLFNSLPTAFAAISAASVGIRSYAELQLLAEQSVHMQDELEEAKARIAGIEKNRPMSFHDFGAEAQTVAILMLQDLEGWARLFRGKAIEA